MKFNKYYFENYPIDTPFDRNNPRYVLSLNGVDEILEKVINSTPYSLSKDDFENTELVNDLLQVDVLQQKEGKLGMAVPFFVERDARILKELSKSVAKTIVSNLIEHEKQIIDIIQKVNNGYSYDRNLYHLLCGYIFDGLLFDFLEEKQLVTTSLVHKTGLDYLVILYEDSDVLNEYSDKLLCSYNRLVVNGKGFASFGDSEGSRRDFYRYMRMKELNQLTEQEREYMNCSVEELIENFEKLIDGKETATKYIEIYEYFGYCEDGKISVPIYDENTYKVADELYKYMLTLIKDSITNALAAIQEEKSLLAIAHGVKTEDIANEIYHLIFGEVNELLVQSGMVAEPPMTLGEGRYFKSFER